MTGNEWEHWPPGADRVGNPIPDPRMLLTLLGSQLVEWLVIDRSEVFVRRIQD